jgi:Na+-driven multidrug efflux pump
MENKSRVAGILSIISGAFSVLGLGWMVFSIYMFKFMFNEPYMPYNQGPPPEFFELITVVYSAFGLFFALLGALAVVGGIFSLKKRRWSIALAGSIASTIIFFPCGIAAVILVAMAQQEFHAPKPFASDA